VPTTTSTPEHAADRPGRPPWTLWTRWTRQDHVGERSGQAGRADGHRPLVQDSLSDLVQLLVGLGVEQAHALGEAAGYRSGLRLPVDHQDAVSHHATLSGEGRRRDGLRAAPRRQSRADLGAHVAT